MGSTRLTPTVIENRKKYLKPPTKDQVLAFVKELGVSYAQFETFYGIAKGTIGLVSIGERDLPTAYWHIIYTKVKPAYGSGFLNSGVNKITTKPITKINVLKPKQIRKSQRLDILK